MDRTESQVSNRLLLQVQELGIPSLRRPRPAKVLPGSQFLSRAESCSLGQFYKLSTNCLRLRWLFQLSAKMGCWWETHQVKAWKLLESHYCLLGCEARAPLSPHAASFVQQRWFHSSLGTLPQQTGNCPHTPVGAATVLTIGKPECRLTWPSFAHLPTLVAEHGTGTPRRSMAHLICWDFWILLANKGQA